MTYLGTSSLLFHYFLSRQILLLQFQDNQFIFMRLPHPNWITNINSRMLALAAGLCSQAGGWQPGSSGSLGCLFSIETVSAGMSSPSFTRSHVNTPFVPWLQRTNTWVSSSCGKNASFLSIILLVAVLWLAFLFKTFSNHYMHFCTHLLHPELCTLKFTLLLVFLPGTGKHHGVIL